MKRLAFAPVFVIVTLATAQQPPAGSPGQAQGRGAQQPRRPPYQLTPEERHEIEAKITELGEMIHELKSQHADDMLIPDVEVYHKAATWIVEFPEEFFTKGYATNTLAVLDTGLERARQLKSGKAPWTTQKGIIILGYRSALDGSIQPMGVTIPESYNGSHPVRLDINLKGRNNSLNEVEFIRTYIDPSTSGQDPQPPVIPLIRRGFKWVSADVGQIELDVFGRGNNAYHWGGEVDIFEAMKSVEKRYKIDPSRVVLRGFSLGGAGAWHLALHQPDRWVATEIGAGTVSRRPQQPGLKPYQQAVLHIWENMPDWSLNAFNLPLAAHDGENDSQLESSLKAKAQLEKEGYPSEGEPDFLYAKGTPAIFLKSLNTGHGISPLVRQRLDAFLKENADRGQHSPEHIRFLTYTTRYNKSYWVTLDELGKHYERAEVDAQRSDGGKKYEITTKNVTRLVLRETNHAADVRIDGQDLRVKSAPEITLERSSAGWRLASSGKHAGLHKTHALQGPIDDAFLDPFLLVRPTGIAWNDAANQQALRALARFDRLYAKYFRAHPPIKDDKDVTEADFAKCNVALFGDPGSNRWIARINGKLPVGWSRETISLGDQKFPASENLPVLVYPNPLSPSHYVVLNTGFTFEEREYIADYAMPRYGDFAVVKVKDGVDVPEAVAAGLFDEAWRLPKELK